MKKIYLIAFLFFSLVHSPLALSWPFPFGDKNQTPSQQQQKKWLQEQQHWNSPTHARTMEHKMAKEHRKWERAQKKKQKEFLKYLQSRAY